MDIFYLLQMVLKINGIFEARRGKKRMKKVSQSTESNSGRGKNFKHYYNTVLSEYQKDDVWVFCDHD